MKQHIATGLGIVLVIAVIVGLSAVFTVHQTQQAIVVELGDPVRVIRDAGLNFKVPFVQNIVTIDKRILDLDAPVEEVISADQKRLVVDAFVRFKIIDPLKFYQTVNNEIAARSRLSRQLNSSLRDVLAGESFSAVLSEKRAELMGEIQTKLNEAAGDFGIEVIDVRIRRADLPEENSQAIFRRMQTERQREASEFRAQGEEAARRVRSRADRDVTVILAEARRDSEILRGQGDAERNHIFAEAFSRDKGFFIFYRSMLAYQRGLQGENTTTVLTPDSDFFRYFGNPRGDKTIGR